MRQFFVVFVSLLLVSAVCSAPTLHKKSSLLGGGVGLGLGIGLGAGGGIGFGAGGGLGEGGDAAGHGRY